MASLWIGTTVRAPEDENALPTILGGLDPNVPSSHEALNAHVLDPETVLTVGPIPWEDVVMEHRGL